MRLFALLVVATGLCYAQRITGSFERTLNVSGFVDLDLATHAGGISLVPGSAGAVRIRGILRSQDNWFGRGEVESRIRELEAHPPITQTGNTIRVVVSDQSLLKGVSMRLEVEAPLDSRLRARANSGGIDVRGIKGPVDGETGSGGITINEIEGDVRAKADSGGIHIRRVNGAVVAQTDSGGIRALEVAGSVDAQTGSGGVRVSQTAPAFIRTRAGSGGTNIALAGTGGYEVRAHAGSGGITATGVEVSGTISRHDLAGKIRGGGPLVDVHSGSGRVEIR